MMEVGSIDARVLYKWVAVPTSLGEWPFPLQESRPSVTFPGNRIKLRTCYPFSCSHLLGMPAPFLLNTMIPPVLQPLKSTPPTMSPALYQRALTTTPILSTRPKIAHPPLRNSLIRAGSSYPAVRRSSHSAAKHPQPPLSEGCGCGPGCKILVQRVRQACSSLLVSQKRYLKTAVDETSKSCSRL